MLPPESLNGAANFAQEFRTVIGLLSTAAYLVAWSAPLFVKRQNYHVVNTHNKLISCIKAIELQKSKGIKSIKNEADLLKYKLRFVVMGFTRLAPLHAILPHTQIS